MASQDLGSFVAQLGLLLLTVHGLGFLFEKLRQPKLLGEILAGALLGPFVLGPWLPAITPTTKTLLDFVSQTGLMLLMFLAGTEAREMGFRKNSRVMVWLLSVGTGLPFLLVLTLGFSGWLTIQSIMGPTNVPEATLIILAIAVTVTSIPVLSRIFQELGILHTPFAGLVLGTAVLEDILLWGVLAIAQIIASGVQDAGTILTHTTVNLAFMVAGLIVFPRLLAKLPQARVNFIARTSLTAWPLLVLILYVSLGHLLGVNTVFAAFLAGFGVVGGKRQSMKEHLAPSLESIRQVGMAFFIPLFFAMVGHKLLLGRGFDLIELIKFFVLSSLLSTVATALAAKCAGLTKLDAVNLALTNNARGGPGIVLAGIAFEAGLVSNSFYTTLVLTAILTSQLAALWLRFVLKKNWPLLT